MPPEPPSVPIRGQRALAAIVVTDGVGFSARMSANEELTLSLIHRDLQMMQMLCEHHDGQVLKSTGDGLLMYFVSAAQAVSCAIAIQHRLAQQATQVSAEEILFHRIGIHLGDVFLSDSDVMGNGVNIAARLQTEAEPGGICMSQTVYDVVKRRLSLSAVYLGPLQLKNIQDAVPAYHIPPIASSSSQVAAGKAFSASAESVSVSAPSPQANEEMAPDQDIGTGDFIHDRYRVQRILGQGGFGRTYLAQDTHRFDDLCVLKEFLPINKSSYVVEKSRDLFEREAKTLYQIDHPQVPKFLAWFTHKNRLFIVQEFIDGKTYAQMLRDRQSLGQQFSEAEVMEWLRDLLEVLSYLHAKGIVHRDISPDNIMLPHGRIKPVLIDFGLVKQTVTEMWSLTSSEQSSQNSFVGKLGYAPPEQIRMGQCFPCSDLYALGVTAIVLLTGREPNLLMDQGSLEWNWRSHAQVSDALAQVIDTMLAEKPKNRYTSAQEALDIIQQLSETGSLHQTVLPPPPLSAPVVAAQSPVSPASASPAPNRAIAVTPKFLEICKNELTKFIGPIASYVVAEAHTKQPAASPAQLLNRLAQEIPDPSQADAFKQGLKKAVLAQMPGPKSQSQARYRQERAATDVPPPKDHSPQGSQPSGHHSPIHQAFRSQTDAFVASQPMTSPPLKATAIEPEFIDRCRLELARCIGPMATLVMDDVLAQMTPQTPQQLVRAIAAEIPDPKKAQEFERHLL